MSNEPLACTDPNIQLAAPRTHELYIYDEIGPDFWGLISGKSFADGIKSLKAKKGDTLTVRINSPGGDVFEAKAIGEAIDRWDGPTVAEIDALAASAATLIAAKAQTVRMADSAMFMVHDPWTIKQGNASEFRRTAEVLDKVGGTILDLYEKKTGKPRDELAALITDTETWMTAEEAKSWGFVDEIVESQGIAAKIRPGLFKHLPEGWNPEERHEHQKTLFSPEFVKYKIEVARRAAGV